MYRTLKKKKCVFISNNSGFTILEVMVSMTVLTIIAPLLALLILSFSQLILIENTTKEWDLFSIQLQNELNTMALVSNTSQSVTLTRGSDQIVFSKYGSVLRKTVNGTGHEIHLTGLSDISFRTEGKVLTIGVRFVNGDEKKSIFYTT
ncbi:hypothetical protein JMA_21250 [Jeotgalibacillus malaysiensis]|uniref:Competence protein ComGF n=1 Tax=Jeotgalibacillus malaysiensis TaxID=1508404 RepID=A0A0B5ARY1_9BACL|nr:competence type IV pilus minor pilin ComGF [Jeotgalibacillus malaysiensis]AJD91442.1 hypothetical protein JMA_21250 [Jeotgalibacillus malaysiensis]